jgi:hypothetical protein
MQNRKIDVKAKYDTGTLLITNNDFNILIVDSFIYFEDEKTIIGYDIYEIWDDGTVSKSLITEDEIESWIDDGLIKRVSIVSGDKQCMNSKL